MAFLDEKEQVIEIKLTQYGKYVLSKGKFNPVFYSFYDDSILYDPDYASADEVQNDVESRIRSNPQMNTQYNFVGVETNIHRINELVRGKKTKLGGENIQPTPEKHYSLSAPLGNSSLDITYAPAFELRFLHNEIGSSIYYITGAAPTLHIPQLSSSIDYEIYAIESGDELSFDTNSILRKTFDDGSTIAVKDDYIIVELSEQNTPFDLENYDIEVYLIEDVEDTHIPQNTKEQITPLSFALARKSINESLQSEDELVESFPELDPTYVEYFLDIKVDSEIDRDKLCEAKREDKTKNLFLEPFLKCDLPEEDERENIFDEDVEEFEDCK